ncbi:MAG: RluA family pseudouridine synthase [Chloroflexota bacterium]|nr:RluA family pseudouridine synthase [Chloroflexota bacterium]
MAEDAQSGAVELKQAEEADAQHLELWPTPDHINERLDRYIAMTVPELSRSYVQQLIESGNVAVDGVRRRPRFKMTPGQVVTVTLPAPRPDWIEPEPIPLAIIFEDEDVLVIDKPAGLVVHPAPGHPSGTLVNAILYHRPEVAVAGTNRPGIVHRLDKETSGLIVVAKTDAGRIALVNQWESRAVGKGYVCLASGVIEPNEATIDAPIGRDPQQRQRMAVIARGRAARSDFAVRRRYSEATLLDIEIETGRTHQIRVHLSFIGHPVAGDAVYGGPATLGGIRVPRQFLHAARLRFQLPGGETVSLDSPLPDDLQHVLDQLDARALTSDQRVSTATD